MATRPLPSASPLLPALVLRWAPSRFLLPTVLAALLALATTWAVLVGGWVNGADGTLLVALTGVAEAALLARASAPRMIAVIAAPLLAFSAVVPFTVGAMPQDGSTSLQHLVGRYVLAMWFPRSLNVNDDWIFTVGLATVLWLCSYFLTWMTVNERRGGYAVFPCFFVLAVNVLNAPIGDNLLIPDTTAGLVAVAIIGQTNFSSMAASWRRRRIAVLPGMTERLTASIAVTLFIVVFVAMMAPPLTTHDYTPGLWQSFRNNSGSSGGTNTGRGTGNGSTAPVGFAGSTLPGGALRDDTPRNMLRYHTDAASPVYLSVAVDSVFSAGEWMQLTSDSVAVDTGAAVKRDSSAGIGAPRHTVHLQVTLLAADATQTTAAPRGAGGVISLVPWIGDLVSVNAPGTVGGFSGNGADLVSVEQFQPDTALAAGSSVDVVSAVSTATAEQLRTAGTNYPAAIVTVDGGGPEAFQDDAHGSLRTIADSWTAGASNPYDVAMAIQGHLRDPTQFQYTLSPPDAPNGTWPIVYFLNTSHKGYCQYFASSMAALLRAKGVPARVVNGYANGSVQSSDSTGVTYLVTSNEAHTWVEAYFPGYGWIPFEPTPPSQVGDYEILPRGPVEQPTPTTNPSATPAPTTRPRPSDTPGAGVVPPPGSNNTQPPAALVTSSVTVLLLLAVAGMVVLWLRRPRDLRALWKRLELVGRTFLGVRRRASDTDAGYAQRLVASIPLDTTTLLHPGGDAETGPRPLRAPVAEALGTIAMLSGKARFSAGGLDAKERVYWLRCWRRVLRALPALLWRRVISRRGTSARRGAGVSDITAL